MKTIKVYRMESPIGQSLWYTPDGTYDPVIKKIINGPAKDLPMDYDPEHWDQGIAWYSAGKTKENLAEWFTKDDAINLINAGYKLYEIEVSEYKYMPHYIIFTKRGIISQIEIPTTEIWK